MKVQTQRYWGDKKVTLTLEAEGVSPDELYKGIEDISGKRHRFEELVAIGARDLISTFWRI